MNLRGLLSEYRTYTRIIFPGGNVSSMTIELVLGQRVISGAGRSRHPVSGQAARRPSPGRTAPRSAGVYVSLSDRRPGTRRLVPKSSEGRCSDLMGDRIDAPKVRVYLYHWPPGGSGAETLRPADEAHAGLGPKALEIQPEPPGNRIRPNGAAVLPRIASQNTSLEATGHGT